MAKVNSEIKKVKEIGGRRVVHPFAASNIFYSFLILILAAAPAGILFLPLVKIESLGLTINGLELFKHFALDHWLGQPYPESFEQFIGYLLCAMIERDPNVNQDLWGSILTYNMVGQAGIMALMFVFSFILLILFIVSLAKGYLRGAKAPKVFVTLDFIFSILFGLSFLLPFFGAMLMGKTTEIFVWFSFIPMGAFLILMIITNISYYAIYHDCLYESDLEYHEDEQEKVVTTHITEVHEVKKEVYEPSKTIPSDIKSIGGHEFSQNQNLQIANVPNGIKSLGNSAFANCLNLKVVSLPDSITEIGYNCFFNCASLERINYAGTKEQWRHIKRGQNWLDKAKTTEVICVDGPIVVNPYH